VRIAAQAIFPSWDQLHGALEPSQFEPGVRRAPHSWSMLLSPRQHLGNYLMLLAKAKGYVFTVSSASSSRPCWK
jgi:hypothetical protein